MIFDILLHLKQQLFFSARCSCFGHRKDVRYINNIKNFAGTLPSFSPCLGLGMTWSGPEKCSGKRKAE